MAPSHLLVCSLCAALVGACGTSADAMSGPGPARDEDLSGASGRNGGKGNGDAGKVDAGVEEAPDYSNACQTIELPKDAAAPQILIVQDRSGSMIGVGAAEDEGRNRWAPSVNALKKLTSELTDTVAFGLMLFPASGSNGGQTGGQTPSFAGCDPGRVDVAVATGSADEIARVLDGSAPDVGATPTAASLTTALAALDTEPCQGCRELPRYVLLVTDGQPTCGLIGAKTTPEDIEATNAAIDALRKAGIKTYVIGYDTASDPSAAAAMDGFAQHGGTERYLPVEDEVTLLTELTRIAGALVPCEFELSADVEDPSFVRVEIDGMTYEYGKDWQLDGRTVSLFPEGGACTKLRDAHLHRFAITRECAPVTLL